MFLWGRAAGTGRGGPERCSALLAAHLSLEGVPQPAARSPQEGSASSLPVGQSSVRRGSSRGEQLLVVLLVGCRCRRDHEPRAGAENRASQDAACSRHGCHPPRRLRRRARVRSQLVVSHNLSPPKPSLYSTLL